jgi:hypothetical protein
VPHSSLRFFIPRCHRCLCSQRRRPCPCRPALRTVVPITNQPQPPPTHALPDPEAALCPAPLSPSPAGAGLPTQLAVNTIIPIPGHRRLAPHGPRRRRHPHPRWPLARPTPVPASMAHTALAPAAEEARHHRPPAPGSCHHFLPVRRRCSSYLSEL